MTTVSEIVNKLRAELDGVVRDEPKHRMLNQLLLDLDKLREDAVVEGYRRGFTLGQEYGFNEAKSLYKLPTWEEKHGMI